jgi:hypothetical protein
MFGRGSISPVPSPRTILCEVLTPQRSSGIFSRPMCLEKSAFRPRPCSNHKILGWNMLDFTDLKAAGRHFSSTSGRMRDSHRSTEMLHRGTHNTLQPSHRFGTVPLSCGGSFSGLAALDSSG